MFWQTPPAPVDSPVSHLHTPFTHNITLTHLQQFFPSRHTHLLAQTHARMLTHTRVHKHAHTQTHPFKFSFIYYTFSRPLYSSHDYFQYICVFYFLSVQAVHLYSYPYSYIHLSESRLWICYLYLYSCWGLLDQINIVNKKLFLMLYP